MKRIEQIVGYDGVARTLPDIEEDFYNSLLRYKDPFASLTEANVVNNMPPGTVLSTEQKKLLKCFRIYKRAFALSTPQKMQIFINKIKANQQYQNLFYVNAKSTDFTKAILKIMNYKGFRIAVTKGIWLAKRLNIKVCPYCNAQFTLVINREDKHKAKFQFDHFFPKNRYPFFCLSVYNLLPSCASCNLSKTEKDFNLQEYYHPYLYSIADEFSYKLKPETQDKFMLKNERLNIADIEFEIPNKSVIVTNHNNVFNFEEIHQRHKDIVQEILYRAKYYPRTLVDDLLKLVDDHGTPLFSDRSEVLKILLGNYTLEVDINNRPLAKFMQDIANDAGFMA